MAKNTLPEDWRDEPCFVVAIPRPLVPYVGGLLKIAESKGFWLDDANYARGYSAITELERCLMSTCLTDLIESNDRLYRMLDTALFGTAYTVESEDPLVVTPAIAPTHSLPFVDRDSVLGRLSNIADVIDNAINGTETPIYDYTPSVKDKLQGIIDAIAALDTDDAAILEELVTIAGVLA